MLRLDSSRDFRNKKKAYLKAKFEELETNSKIKISFVFQFAIQSLKIKI